MLDALTGFRRHIPRVVLVPPGANIEDVRRLVG
jgi:hypothetical protein